MAKAYELHLRANQMQLLISRSGRKLSSCIADRSIAIRSSRRRGRGLGRCYRLIGKFGDPASAEANTARGSRRSSVRSRSMRSVTRPSVLRLRRGRGRSRSPGDGAAAQSRPPCSVRAGAVRRTGSRLSPPRSARCISGGIRACAAARSRRGDQRGADVPVARSVGTCSCRGSERAIDRQTVGACIRWAVSTRRSR